MKQLFRTLLRRYGLIMISDDHVGARFATFPPESLFDVLLLRTFPAIDRLRFIQIGANDGSLADPISRYLDVLPWSGVLVEPLAANFTRLQKRRGRQSGLTLLHAALDLESGQRAIYDFSAAAKAGAPAWAGGLASFSRERLVEAAANLGLSTSTIERHDVRTVTWNEVWATFQGECDLLVVDTEGYDIPLLRAADLERRRPRMILFEHSCHTEEDRFAFYRELSRLGYEIASEAGDTIATLPPNG